MDLPFISRHTQPKKMPSGTVDVDALFEKNLKGYGPVRLSKLPEADLLKLLKLYEVDPPPELLADRVSAILSARHMLRLTRGATADGVSEDDNKPPTFAPKRHQLRLLALNTLKLRVGRAALQSQWMSLVGVIAALDVALLSEVPAGEADERTKALVALVQSQTKDNATWSYVLSEPSGPGNPEVHAILYKSPLKLLASQTLHTAGGVSLDHAPLVAKFEDSRFSTNKTVVLTSVHFPPAGRAKERDTQIKALIQAYPKEVALRLDEPFDQKGAKDARKPCALHVIGGDWNVYPSTMVDLEASGWGCPLVGSKVSTSAGRKAYDHWVPSGFTSSSFNLGWDVLELMKPQNSTKGEIGLSDHSPILMSIREVTTTSGAKVEADSKVKLYISDANETPNYPRGLLPARVKFELSLPRTAGGDQGIQSHRRLTASDS